MILDKLNAVFVHIPKTAGSSISKNLSQWSTHPVEEFGEWGNVKTKNKHYGATQHIREMGKEKWASYLSFCVVRNPYARVLSNYRWILECKIKKLRDLSFEEYVLEGCPFFLTCSRYTHHEGELAINSVLRYERLAEEYPAFIRSLGVKTSPLPTNNKVSKESSGSYQGIYTRDMKDIVNQVCRKDFENFAYDRE